MHITKPRKHYIYIEREPFLKDFRIEECDYPPKTKRMYERGGVIHMVGVIGWEKKKKQAIEKAEKAKKEIERKYPSVKVDIIKDWKVSKLDKV